MSIQYYVLDTETTGLKPGWNEINQLSIIRDSDKFQKTFHIKVKHPERASAEALAIQKISKADLYKGQDIEDVIKEVDKFLLEDNLNPESRCIIGHNIQFDRKFCQTTWEANKQKFLANLWLCTKKFYKHYVTKVGSEIVMKKQAAVQPGETKVKFGQDLCLVGAGFQPKLGAHSAAMDTQNCYTLWKFLMNENLNHVRVIENLPHRIAGEIISSEIFEDY